MRRFHVWTAVLSLTLLLAPALSSAQGALSASGARKNLIISQQSDMERRGDFLVGPTRFVVELAPGEEGTIETAVTSREGDERSYSVDIEDFAISNDGLDNVEFYGKGSGPFSAKSWITPAAMSFTLKHGERASIPVKITVPKNAAVGDHYVAVLFKRAPKDPSAAGFNIVARVGVLLLITVKGDLIREGTMQQFLATQRVYWSLPAKLNIQYRNSGTVHIVPTGSVEIRNIFGIPVDEVPVKDWYVLRDSTRRREITWQPRFALGFYSATLHLNAVDGSPEIRQTVSFWVIPALPVILALLAIFAVSFMVQAFFSRFEIRSKGEKNSERKNE